MAPRARAWESTQQEAKEKEIINEASEFIGRPHAQLFHIYLELLPLSVLASNVCWT